MIVDPSGGCFGKLKYVQKQEYFTRQVAFMHSLIATPLAFYAAFGQCNVLTSDTCLVEPSKAQTYLILISSGFCSYDLAMCVLKLNYTCKVQ